jgi:cyclin C
LSSTGQVKTGDSENKGGGAKSKIQRLANWLAESNIDIEAIVDSTQEIISFYEVQEQYNEKLTREQINRFVKARGLDK